MTETTTAMQLSRSIWDRIYVMALGGVAFFLQMIAFFAPNACLPDADRSTTTKASIPSIIGKASKEMNDDDDDDPPVSSTVNHAPPSLKHGP